MSYVITDDFTGTDGDAPKPLIWGWQASPAEIQSNAWYIDKTGGISISILRRPLQGDFDAEISFSGVGFTEDTQYLVLRLEDAEEYYSNFYALLYRDYDTGNRYYAEISAEDGINSDDQEVATSDTSGKLRITRVGRVFTAYYWGGSSWTQLVTLTDVSSNALSLYIGGGNSHITQTTFSIDDFSVTADNFGYPELVVDTSTDLDDTFVGYDGQRLNPALWTNKHLDALMDEQFIEDGGLSLSTTEWAAVATTYLLVGDFDIQVDFEFTNLVNYQGVSLQAFVDDDDLVSITREYNTEGEGNGYVTSETGDVYPSFISSTDNSGKLRMVRVGETTSGYYWNGSGWTLIGTMAAIAAEKVRVSLSSFTYQAPVTVVVNNFVKNSGNYNLKPTVLRTSIDEDFNMANHDEPATAMWVTEYCEVVNGALVLSSAGSKLLQV